MSQATGDPDIIGQEWAEAHPDKYRGTGRQPFPCPICQDPTGACTNPEGHMPRQRKPVDEPIPDTGRRVKDEPAPPADLPDGFQLVPGTVNMMVPVRDVYIQFTPRGSTRPSTVLAFPRGQAISVDGYQSRVDMYKHHSAMEVK